MTIGIVVMYQQRPSLINNICIHAAGSCGRYTSTILCHLLLSVNRKVNPPHNKCEEEQPQENSGYRHRFSEVFSDTEFIVDLFFFFFCQMRYNQR
jgi:hypothetical protein